MSDKPRILLVHPGTQHAPRLAEALERRGLLYRFWTGVAGPCSDHRLPAGRRVDIPAAKLRTLGWLERAAQLASRTGLDNERVWHRRNALFQRLVPDGELTSADVIVGFDTSSWILARRAKRAGRGFVLDQTVGHPLARAGELTKLGLGSDIWPAAFAPRWRPLREAERCEHELADRVVVAGSFSARTLHDQGVPQEKIAIIPYGVADEFLNVGAARASNPPLGGPKFLFAGHLSPRKGVGVLLQAWSKIDITGASLRLAGGGDRQQWQPRNSPASTAFLGQTPRTQLLEEFKQASIFVFPSLFEGFALVLLEAMAAGLPIITTPNTAGPDLIEHGREGLIVPAGDANALEHAMFSVGSEPHRAAAMGRAAHEKAKRYTWGRYGEAWAELLCSLT